MVKKTILGTLMFVLTFSFSFGQSISETIDSLTNIYLNELAANERPIFEKIVKNRDSVNFRNRIDSSRCDYIFIHETICLYDSSLEVTERYFTTSQDSSNYYYRINPVDYGNLPSLVYVNGLLNDFRFSYYMHSISGVVYVNIYETYFTLPNLMERAFKLKLVQELDYDSTLPISYDADSSSSKRKALEKIEVRKLKSKRQIITMVDKINKTVKVSLQLPALNPVVQVRFVKIEYQQW